MNRNVEWKDLNLLSDEESYNLQDVTYKQFTASLIGEKKGSLVLVAGLASFSKPFSDRSP